GIRDFHVTGVQTCALPIWNGAVRMGLRDLLGTVARVRCAVGCVLIGLGASVSLGTGAANASPWAEVGDSQLRSDIEILANYGLRSEERRVGKECLAGRWQC